MFYLTYITSGSRFPSLIMSKVCGTKVDGMIRQRLKGESPSHLHMILLSNSVSSCLCRVEIITLLIDFAMLQGFILEMHKHDPNGAAQKYTRALNLFRGATKRWPELFTTRPHSAARYLTTIPHGKLFSLGNYVYDRHLLLRFSPCGTQRAHYQIPPSAVFGNSPIPC